MNVKHVCSYCGGRDTESPDDLECEIVNAVAIESVDFKVIVCVWCFKKVFDLALGKTQEELHAE